MKRSLLLLGALLLGAFSLSSAAIVVNCSSKYGPDGKITFTTTFGSTDVPKNDRTPAAMAEMPTLIAKLAMDGPDSEQAVLRLGTSGEAAVAPLREALKTTNLSQLRNAGLALLNIGTPSAMAAVHEIPAKPLVSYFDSGDEKYLNETALLLATIGSTESQQEIRSLVSDFPQNVLAMVVMPSIFAGLAIAPQKELLPEIEVGLRDTNFFVCVRAIQAYSRVLGSNASAEKLIALLPDKRPEVRHYVIRTLSTVYSPQVEDTLITALLFDADTDVRCTAANVLANYGSPATIPYLLRACKDQDAALRAAACLALGKFRNRPEVADMMKALQGDPDAKVRAAAADALKVPLAE